MALYFAEPLTAEQLYSYRRAQESDGQPACPFCQSKDVNDSPPGSDYGFLDLDEAFKDLKCNACHRWWREFYSLIRIKEITNPPKCSECKGTGKLTEETSGGRYEEYPCPTCKGTGR